MHKNKSIKRFLFYRCFRKVYNLQSLKQQIKTKTKEISGFITKNIKIMPKSKKKGNKAKLKKLQRLKELEENKKRTNVVKYANYVSEGTVKNTLEDFAAFKKYNRNGLDIFIEFTSGATMDEDTKTRTYEVLKENMKQMYDKSGWGWNNRKKMKEHTDPDARFLIARNVEGEVIGFTHFRFLIEHNKEVLYIFELQVAINGRRCGLGRHMMQICELMARKNSMKFVMLTVFKNNLNAMSFYRNKMKYDIDDISPSECGDDDADYEILSKCVDPALKKLKQTARRNVNDVIQEEKLKSKLFVQENAAAQTPSKAIINKNRKPLGNINANQ